MDQSLRALGDDKLQDGLLAGHGPNRKSLRGCDSCDRMQVLCVERIQGDWIMGGTVCTAVSGSPWVRRRNRGNDQSQKNVFIESRDATSLFSQSPAVDRS